MVGFPRVSFLTVRAVALSFARRRLFSDPNRLSLTFWSRSIALSIAATTYYAPLNGWMRAFNTASFATTATFIASMVTQLPALRLAALLFFLIAFACLVVHQVRRRRMTAELLNHVTRGAERTRAERLTREYQRYLVDAS